SIVMGKMPTQWFYPPLLPEQIAIAIIAPIGEEYGWRGYALPRLQKAVGPLSASLVIGAVWAVWHVPTMFVPGASLFDLARMLPLLLAASVVYTWLYDTTGRSMRVILLAHFGAHLDNVFRGGHSGGGFTPLDATIVVLVMFASWLVAIGRLVPADR